MNSKPEEIVFSGSATASINLPTLGVPNSVNEGVGAIFTNRAALVYGYEQLVARYRWKQLTSEAGKKVG